MSSRLKRKEDLRDGLQRISEERLRDTLQVMGKTGLNAEMVHEARKMIKSLRAILRLATGTLSVEGRKTRNKVLRDLADRLSGPRDAAVILAAFEEALTETLQNKSGAMIEPSWAAPLRESLEAEANAVVPAESYQEAVEGVRRLVGQLLPFEGVLSKSAWDKVVGKGLRKTYRQGRRLLYRIASTPPAPEEQWHGLRKRAKDLGYQLSILSKVRGVKPLLTQLDEVGSMLGDARDLSLVRERLSKVEDTYELTPADRQSFQQLLTHIDGRRQGLHQRAVKSAERAYRRASKRFTAQMVKRGRRWQGG